MKYFKILKYRFKRIKGEVVDLKMTSYLSEAMAIDKTESLDFDIIVNNRRVGNISMVLTNNEYTYYYGNVGYEVDKAYQGHHYAYHACMMVFKFARDLGIKELIITCNVDNVPSIKTILKCGGIFEKRVDVPNRHPLYLAGEKEKLVYRILL